MPKITRLPSGSYRCQAYSHTTPEGKKVYASITGKTKKEVTLALAKWLQDKKNREPIVGTVGAAIDAYIASKSNILSPSTIRNYRHIQKSNFNKIKGIPLSKLTLLDVQFEINDISASVSPKTARNVYALLRSSLINSGYKIDRQISLPQKEKPDIKIPSEAEMKILFNAVKDKPLEIPVYLAAICGMRRSEIVALKWNNVDFNKSTIKIDEAIILGDKYEVTTKAPKTTAGKRIIKMSGHVSNLLKEQQKIAKDEFVSPLTLNNIYDRFVLILKKNNLPHYRFHDLRHYAVSVMLSLNIPKNYIASIMGHSTEHMVEQVYGHIMSERKTEFEDRITDYFDKII